ncbi:hypothetical protein [Rosenbergiella australiborealis]|uniref:hypothetical protein n=1 Tax=Rosenbergiella australiborealis TaxID=1544696 RepID=UPI001F4EA2B2|nr:hypothetical protein [Rosenbergiella australiborealis]
MENKLEQAFKKAAQIADTAVNATMLKYSEELVTDEDDITGVLIGQLDAAFNCKVDGIVWSSSILRHRKGRAAQEKKVGADMLLHVSFKTPELTYSKGILIQSKRVDQGTSMSQSEHTELLNQCKKMQGVTSASFVFNYTKSGMRCASATKIAGTKDRKLHDSCNLTSYKFFLELFQCTYGDRNITSARFDELQIPRGISIEGELVNYKN